MSKCLPHQIEVTVVPHFIEEQSAPEEQRYIFAYTVNIRNQGSVAARLISRHWVITDANGNVQEVRGQGVVGEQPHLKPGEAFQYTSGAVLDTAVGTMSGTYQMLGDDGLEFDAEIPAFTLAVPRVLH
ncbi:MAG TPA: Co2+/Mg2+ efflux protein ApaG [Gammaproteobacteria bacterium]|nr:Co2+/Mg2+ efflux protein ApaG [Gammaproteobacteria bacterium]